MHSYLNAKLSKILRKALQIVGYLLLQLKSRSKFNCLFKQASYYVVAMAVHLWVFFVCLFFVCLDPMCRYGLVKVQYVGMGGESLIPPGSVS